MIEIGWRAADPDHAVRRARAAEHLAARPRNPPARGPRLWHGLERPVLGRAREVEGTSRIVDRLAGVGSPGLEHEHVSPGIDEPARDDRTGAARADDDELGLPIHAHPPIAACPTSRSDHSHSRAADTGSTACGM